MKRPFIYALAIAMLSLLFYVSCSKGNDSFLTANSSALILPGNAIGRFCFDGNLGVIGYKTNDSVNQIINFDTTNFTVSYGDTLFKCSHFRIHHDMAYPNIAYLTFSGVVSSPES